MSERGGRSLGFLFGAVGGLLVVVQGLVDLARGAYFWAVGRPHVAFGELAGTVLYVVLGLVFVFFAALGSSRASDRTLAAGVVLFVIGLLGFLLLGFGSGLLSLLGAVFVLIGGLLFILAGR